MDPFVATIIKQAVVFGAVVGIGVALLYGIVQYAKLQHALTLNMTPGQLP